VTLEQQIDQIAADHGVDSIAVGRMPVGERIVWTATVHWSGFSRTGTACVHGYSDDSIQGALSDALKQVAAARVPGDVPVPTLAPMQEAA
jgi:hypothetical protein